jgi:hypothetical protein
VWNSSPSGSQDKLHFSSQKDSVPFSSAEADDDEGTQEQVRKKAKESFPPLSLVKVSAYILLHSH